MTWRTIKIWDFLTERKDRMTPDEANISGISRLEKIDFSGTIHVREWKDTNTWMIAVYPWDLVISGINVEKGALAVYEWTEKILATIHYSSYEYNPEMIDIEYLRYFSRSSTFRKIILEQAWWGIKTEIKAKKFLALQIFLPDLDSQKKIVNTIQWVENEIKKVNEIIGKNIKLSKQLKSSILQDAIQWKLVPQDPTDEHTSILIEKIQAEKTKLIAEWKMKKQKLFSAIKPDEILYELPIGWKWVRLGDILELVEYWTSEKAGLEVSQIPVLRMGNIQNGQVDFTELKFLDRKSKDIPKLYLKSIDLLFNRTNSFELVWKTAIFLEPDDTYTFAWYLIRLRVMRGLINPFYVNNYINSQIFRKTQIEPTIVQQCWQANYNGSKLVNTVFPLPPLNEQIRILQKTDELMRSYELLDQQVTQAKERSEKLMESVLQGVFNW